MWESDYEESWALKNWCFGTVVLEKTLESPLDCKEIQPVHPKGDQSWVFIWRTDAEAETPVLWPPHVKSWLIGKDSDAGRDWGQEKGKIEDEMAGWHHRLNAHEFVWTPGVGDGQGGLACCDSWGHKELNMTERLNWTELRLKIGTRQHGRGIGWGDHFLPHKFIKRSFEWWATSTKQLVNTGRRHLAPRKAAHSLWKKVGQNIKDKKRDKRIRDEDLSWRGSREGGEVSTQ